MTNITNSTNQSLIKQIEEETIDMAFVTALVGERQLTKKEQTNINRIMEQRGESVFQDLMFALTMHEYPEDRCKQIWDDILQHKHKLEKILQRNPGIVVAALDYLSNVKPDETSLYTILPQDKFDTIIERAAIDGLTKLYDHKSFLWMLQKELDRAQRYRHDLSILMIDIDDFKLVNDNFGHQQGDEILVSVASRTRNNLRKMDSCGRYGGEEFSVILPRADNAYGCSVAERIRENIHELNHPDLSITVSIGVSSYPDDGNDITKLIQAADTALYFAKNNGKDQIKSTRSL